MDDTTPSKENGSTDKYHVGDKVSYKERTMLFLVLMK